MGSSSRIDILRDQHQSEQEYIIIEREGEYPTPVYHSVVSLDRGRDFYNIYYSYVCFFERARWEAMSLLDCTNSEIPHV